MTAALVVVYVPVVGLRVSSCCRSPWASHRLSPLGLLLLTYSRCHSLPIGPPSPPPQNKIFLALAVLIQKNKKLSRRVSSIRLFPARQRLSPS